MKTAMFKEIEKRSIAVKVVLEIGEGMIKDYFSVVENPDKYIDEKNYCGYLQPRIFYMHAKRTFIRIY